MNTSSDDQLNDFERALLTDLREHVTLRAQTEAAPASVTPLKTRRRGTRLGLAAAAVAAAMIGSVSLLGGGTAAYAIDTGNDGAITVRILDRSDADGLVAALAEHGITAEVDYSGNSAVTVMEGADGVPALVPTDDTPPPNAEPVQQETPNVPTFVTASSGDEPCPGTDGGTKPPIEVERSGDGFELRLTGGAVKDGANLELAIFAGGYTEGVAGVYTDGALTCGAETVWGSVR